MALILLTLLTKNYEHHYHHTHDLKNDLTTIHFIIHHLRIILENYWEEKKKQEHRKGWLRSRRSAFIYGRKSARVVHLAELEWPTTLRRVVAIATITVSGKWEIPASLMKVFNRQNCCTGFRVSNPRTGSWRGPRMKIEIAFSPGIR